jgi:outer membrane protein OmpA-like peptidoglycan-associated protein
LSPFSNQPKNRCVFKGFASNKGNPVYNQNLSLQRTENKKNIWLKKIHPSRILTQYHGIDYGATKEELARRVELSFIIRVAAHTTYLKLIYVTKFSKSIVIDMNYKPL